MNQTPNVEATDIATEDAARKAREIAGRITAAVTSLDREQLVYLVALTVVVGSSLVFDMASFRVHTDYAVSETTAQAQRVAEAKLNSWSYSAFSSCIWGKLMWLAAIGGIASTVLGASTKSTSGWLPLSQIGLAVATTLSLMLIYVVGFPDLSAYDDASVSATLFGYWLPLLAACAAVAVSVKRLVF